MGHNYIGWWCILILAPSSLDIFGQIYILFSGNASEEQIESFLRGAEDESGRDSGTLAARVKKARQAAIVKKIEAEMTEDEKLNEQDVQRKQLEKIFSLLNQHESDVGKMSENDLQNQLKMYKQQFMYTQKKNNFRCLVNKNELKCQSQP